VNIGGRILHRPIRVFTSKGFRLNPEVIQNGQEGLQKVWALMRKNGIRRAALVSWLEQKAIEHYSGPGVGGDAPAILALLGSKRSIPILEKALQRPRVKHFGNNEYEIIRALDLLGSRGSAKLFIKLLKSPRVFIDRGPRLEMIKFFSHFRVKEALPVLREQLAYNEPGMWEVVGQSLIALAHINPKMAQQELAVARERAEKITPNERKQEFKEYCYWANEIANGHDVSRLRGWMQ
jgi:hypothetical protein